MVWDLKRQSERLGLTMVGIAAAFVLVVLTVTFAVMQKTEVERRGDALTAAALVLEAELGHLKAGEATTKAERRLADLFHRRAEIFVSRELPQNVAVDKGIGAFASEGSSGVAFGYFPVPGDPLLVLVKVNWARAFVYADTTFAAIMAGTIILVNCLLLWFGLGWQQRNIAKPALKRIQALERQAELSQAVQSLAHDIRKPFSTVRAVLKAMAEPSGAQMEAERLKALARNMLPELEQLLADVDQMIGDVLAFEKPMAAQVEAVTVEHIVERALAEAARHHAAQDIALTYRLNVDQKVEVDRQALVRVVANLLGNAVEAMHGKGNVWIHADMVAKGSRSWVRLAVGNDGSYIPPEVMERLFRPFSTRGKKGGTGLGLASARRIVEAHGGELSAKSDAKTGTEFFMMLPVARGQLAKTKATLPARWSDLSMAVGPVGIDDMIKTVIAQLQTFSVRSGSPLLVGAVDDEAAAWLDVHLTADSDLASVTKVTRSLVDAGILFGMDAGLVTSIREHNQAVPCVFVAAPNATGTAVDDLERLGVSVLHAPVPRLRLARVLLDAATRQMAAAPSAQRSRIAVVDDDLFILELWQQCRDGVDVLVFGSPEKFLAEARANPKFLGSLDAVIIDFHYGMNSSYDGSRLAREIKELADVAIVLTTDMPDSMQVDRSVVDCRMPKGDFSWLKVRSELESQASGRANGPRRSIA